MPGRNGRDSTAYPRTRVRLAYRACRRSGCGEPKTVVAEAYGGRRAESRIEEATVEDLRSTPPIRFAQAQYVRIKDSLSGVPLDSVVLRVSVRMNPGWRIAADSGAKLHPPILTAKSYSIEFGPPAYPHTFPVLRGAGTIAAFDTAFKMEMAPRMTDEERKNFGRSMRNPYPETQARFRYQACNGPVCLPPKEATISFLGTLGGYFNAEEPYEPR